MGCAETLINEAAAHGQIAVVEFVLDNRLECPNCRLTDEGDHDAMLYAASIGALDQRLEKNNIIQLFCHFIY